ncbi:MAG: sensor histidine kinase, partial [Propionibacteriales bacterium]|nr:sensor histidine kinase [Propionibacteriales bacterium]
MPSLTEVVADHTDLSTDDLAQLQLLTAQWHLLADLSFSDLVLWVPDTDPHVFWSAAQIRPATGPTALFDDVVGDPIAYVPEHLVTGAFVSEATVEAGENKLQAGIPVDMRAIPIRRDGRVIAVLELHTNQVGVRGPSILERNYLSAASDLAKMVEEGTFPVRNDWPAHGPHVGDGIMRLDLVGDVLYASPNAVSAYRRLGLWQDLEDENLAELTQELAPQDATARHEAQAASLSGRIATEIEVVTDVAQILLRTIPLIINAERVGAIVLCRDVTDLRRRERELVTKNATIREIHHRVKNNLQTVAALLRMQARRMDSPEAAEALREAMARVSSIAVVHEVLSQVYDERVEFDEVADRIVRMVGRVATTDSDSATVHRRGSFGIVSADVATSLSLVLTELCQNAIEHGLAQGAGEVVVMPSDEGDRLRVQVIDRGAGLPTDFDLARTASLGLSIVTTLVTDLGGT